MTAVQRWIEVDAEKAHGVLGTHAQRRGERRAIGADDALFPFDEEISPPAPIARREWVRAGSRSIQKLKVPDFMFGRHFTMVIARF